MERANKELRLLMESLQDEYRALEHDHQVSMKEGDLEAGLTCLSLQRQLREIMSQLLDAMNNIGMLHEEEMKVLKK